MKLNQSANPCRVRELDQHFLGYTDMMHIYCIAILTVCGLLNASGGLPMLWHGQALRQTRKRF